MGLAPYGNPRYVDLILDNLINIRKMVAFSLIWLISTMRPIVDDNKKFSKLFGGPPKYQKQSLLSVRWILLPQYKK